MIDIVSVEYNYCGACDEEIETQMAVYDMCLVCAENELARLWKIEKALLAGIPREGKHGVIAYLLGLKMNETHPFWRDYLNGIVEALKVE